MNLKEIIKQGEEEFKRLIEYQQEGRYAAIHPVLDEDDNVKGHSMGWLVPRELEGRIRKREQAILDHLVEWLEKTKPDSLIIQVSPAHPHIGYDASIQIRKHVDKVIDYIKSSK